MTTVKRALLSVTDKRGLVPLAQGLVDRGYELVSTGGTAKLLEAEAVPVTLIAAVTNMNECMGGRVKTLHPAIFGGILARRELTSDLAELGALGGAPIDVVVVNLYAFDQAAARAETQRTLESEMIEQIDIGGPSLLRAAAKNNTHVWVVVDPDDYAAVLDGLELPAIEAAALRRSLAAKAFRHTARYDTAIASWFDRDAPDFGTEFSVGGTQVGSLRYGENPHQNGRLYRTGSGFADATVHQGKALSYNNWLDLAAAYELAGTLTGGPAAVIVKHTNPCGAAVDQAGLEAAYVRALATDPTSAFGGIVALNGLVEVSLANRLMELFLEVVIAPAFTADALALLRGKKNLRVLTLPLPLTGRGPHVRSIRGGLLVQDADRDVVSVRSGRVVTKRTPTEAEYAALQFAWETASHVKSNAIVFADGTATVAVGAGQMSRVDSVLLCRHKARRPLTGSVAASDAFFPFRDGVDVLREAGATAIVQPGGSVRDEEVIAAADEFGLAMVMTGQRHFRH
jgi:phosphoribosylaminoimidazolecarboxamide formyltransferase/IMP cyclohydrolase